MPTLDREQAKAAGYTDAEIDSFLAKRKEVSERANPSRSLAPPPSAEIPFQPNARATAGSMARGLAKEGTSLLGTMAREAAPSLAAGVATALVPGAGVPAMLLRLLAAPAAAFPTALAGQAATGQPLDPGAAGLRALMETGGQGAGEVLGLAPRLGLPLMRSALRVGKGTAREAVEMGSKLAGKQLAAPEVDLAEQALKERVSPGGRAFSSVRGKGPRQEFGSLAVGEKMAAPMRERAKMLARFDKDPNVRASLSDLTANYGDLRREFGSSKDPKLNAWFEKRIRTFADEMKETVKLKGGRTAQRPKKMTPSELQKLVADWSAEAEAVYKNPSAPVSRQREAQFKAAIADAGRQWLRDLTPSAAPGGIGQIESLNRRYRSLMPLEKAMQEAELPHTNMGAGLAEMFNPIRYIPPNVKGRTALQLTKPGLAGGLRQAPRATGLGLWEFMTLLDQMQRGAEPESASYAEVVE